MQPNKQQDIQSQEGQLGNPLPEEISQKQKELNKSAHDTADKDMDADVELTAHSPNDDLDEGETATLGEDVPQIL